MIRREWKRCNLEDAFFPVELCDLKFVYPKERDLFGKPISCDDLPIPDFKAVVDMERRHALTTVTKKYRLVTNKEAYTWAEPVVGTVFNHTKLADFTCFNVRLSKTRANCCIDLVRVADGGNVIQFTPFGKDDPWTAFIRIENSYNRTSCLKYRLGFCRWICQNGVIFKEKSVDFAFTHTQGIVSEGQLRRKLQVGAQSKIGEIQSLEDEFIAKLKKLREHPLPAVCMLALVCKVFGLHMTRDRAVALKGLPLKNAQTFVTTIKELVKEYSGEFGENAYAAMNVLTDYASFPKGLSVIGGVSRLQPCAGDWIDGFIFASSASDFNITKYLGDDAIESATWFASLVAA